MLSFLKNHPFAVEAFFKSSVVLTFAYPTEELESFLPNMLALDTFNDKWAFIAVAVVETKNLRPKNFPEMLGRNFFLIGYRIFVKYFTNEGKRLRGLYILKSETDKRSMQLLGNIFTHYKYNAINITNKTEGNIISINSPSINFNLQVEKGNHEVAIPAHSPFENWKEARRFAGPLPFTFTVKGKEVLIVEGVRQQWVPQPVHVLAYNIPFLNSLNLNEGNLANAFIIENVPYYWKKGKIEICNR